ncbi:vanadium-dependent haloperoxidase [Pseudoflavitalea sp. X16]|uniref:vanadium-dependent haloperoxidase n=1 Tax=Paraflavitalea devenefica TaxID=2716334 RepID=UPI00141FA7EA|nr:vanadium-dependent haloperoxidase [Paraflavitalea devenefica]NII27658.1 vanadium-dependent haloperoxidase [Paraflavitalea devenefica]
MKQKMNPLALAVFLLSLLAASCSKDKDPSPKADDLPNDVILVWNEVAFEATGGKANTHSLLTSRVYAMVHAAMHDAVNATRARYQIFAFHEKDRDAHPVAAAASAAHRVLKATFTSRASFLDSALNSSLAGIPPSASKTAGIALGEKAADALLALNYNHNGAEDPVGQPAPAVKPGDYKVVPPFTFIFAPFWQDSKLWSLQTKSQFRCPPPPALTSDAYATAFNEVKQVGSINSATRTAEQSSYAKYWYETSEIGWNRIARNVAKDKKTGLFATARLFALLNFAIADAYTAGWDSKLHYNLWRPFTAIREADTDGNAVTTPDLLWEPAEPTPPIQDYPSTHSALGNAAATVLAYVYGDYTSFTMRSPTASPDGATRGFKSFSQAANENADSRVMAGIHFRFACVAGQELGNKIGQWTTAHYLKPINKK